MFLYSAIVMVDYVTPTDLDWRSHAKTMIWRCSGFSFPLKIPIIYKSRKQEFVVCSRVKKWLKKQ